MQLRRMLRTAVILGLPPMLAAATGDLIQVTGVRSWSHPDSTRIVIETSGAFEFRSDQAVNPDRLYVDIFRARPWIAKNRVATHEVGDSLVRRVRIAENAPGTTRVVFDLASPVDFRITTLNSPDRLVVELRPHAAPETPQPIISAVDLNDSPARQTAKAGRAGDLDESQFAKSDRLPQRRAFVFPARANRRPLLQIAMGGTAPPIPMPTMDSDPLYFADPIASFMAANAPRAAAAVRVAANVAPPSATTLVLPATRPAGPSAALASENATRSLTRALGLKVNRVVIDAGHGGHDQGTVGPHGVMEKDVVLDVALRLSKLVQQKMGAEVVLTRSDDTFIPLHERTAIANERKADLFLSIHANSSPAPEVAGTETFFLNFTSSPDALNVAARENAGSDKSVGELKDLIQTITLNDKIEESHTFAEDIQSAIQGNAARSNAAARNRGVKRAPFVVLIGAGMPSVLAEIGFLSNPRDESNLNKPEYRQKVAEALYKGLSQYAQSLSHFDMPKQLTKTAESKTTEKPAPAGLN